MSLDLLCDLDHEPNIFLQDSVVLSSNSFSLKKDPQFRKYSTSSHALMNSMTLTLKIANQSFDMTRWFLTTEASPHQACVQKGSAFEKT